ncbi:desmethyl-deoxy-podophyllotoxin synthase-like [Hordeum vulgare subsp. vulgare]|uniref:desmethyl-deoxy-podophyllotoxin synthase-like n=1 Tax=Hordeum vulgare subsp. vulgare TaxID=112509 RepID=UPI000B464992|nr:desmethyl-deoxy-podophyllotoxin synthase-like [Hordeum vulgare subsp. vulgare]
MDMDQLSYGSLWVMAVATALFWLILRKAIYVGGKDDTGAKAKLPPGPWNLPVIGSLHHLVVTKLPPHRALLRLSRRHGPLMLVWLGEVPSIVVSSPEAAKEVLKTNDLVFANRPCGPTMDIVSCGGKGILLAPYGDHWRQMRKVCVVEVLSARQVRRIESIQQAEVARLLESVSAAATGCAVVDVGKALAELSSNIIATAVFGGKFPQQEAFLREIDALSVLVGGFSMADLFPSSRLVRWLSSATHDVKRSHARVQRILEDIIQERKEKTSKNGASSVARDNEDLLDVLLRLQRDDTLNFPLTSEIIDCVIRDIIGAATETTSSTIEWAMAELVGNPEAMAKAKHEVRERCHGVVASADIGELQYLRMVIKETLRLHPAGMFHRASLEDCQVMGYHIPKGTAVMINGFAVGTDPAHWGEDAGEFRPERFHDMEMTEYMQMEFVPFGAGRRQCPGTLFATTIMELVLAHLLCHFDWEVPDGQTLDMGEDYGFIVHTRSSLRLQASSIVPSC